jgi:DNA-3-methyladenine glycosylase II
LYPWRTLNSIIIPMQDKHSATGDKSITLNIVKPYDFALTLKAIHSFEPSQPEQSNRIYLATRIERTPALIEISPDPKDENRLTASCKQQVNGNQIREIAEWVLFAELDLTPFYLLTDRHPKLGPITRKLRGLKPTRPISLFEMAVIAITEQQISLAAAYGIRSRIVQRFGEQIGNYWIFPEPGILAEASVEDLRSCGLSRQKAQYIQGLAAKIADGTLDLDILKTIDDETAGETIVNLRGFGRWSADYILARGLARPDCVPVDDIAIRSVVGEYLADGQRLSSDELTRELEPFRPYRGLLAFYLLAGHRLKL